MLVYVPYFFTGGTMSKSHLFCPVYNYVDKIIVQSEKVIIKFTNPVIKRKLVPLGSPKADKMIWLEEQKPTLPEGWAEIIKNRKVVFHNTSISSLLMYGKK